MLILTRRIGESVYIGDEVRLTVLGVRGTQVRIGINAPKDIPVHREEIYYKIKHEQGGGAVPSGDGGDEHQQPGNLADDTPEDTDAPADDDEQQPSAEEADPNNA